MPIPNMRQHLTVEKPSNGLQNNEHLQKSHAKTNTNTVQVSLMSGNHFTPNDKHPQHMSDVDNYSDKFTPENAVAQHSHAKHARAEKILSKEQDRIRKAVGATSYP